VKRTIGYFVGATLLVALAYSTIAHFQSREDVRAQAEREATVAARALAHVAAEAQQREDGEAVLQAFVAQLPRERVPAALVLKSNKLLAHHDVARVGQRLDPESLTDKSLFDVASRAKAAVTKNMEEHERTPGLARDPYPEVELSTRPDGTIAASAPVKVEDRYVALASVELRPSAPRSHYPTALLIVALTAALGFVVIARVAPAKLAMPLGVVLLVGAAAAGVSILADWRTALERERFTDTSQVVALLGEAGLVRTTAPERLDALASTLVRAPDGVVAKDLLAVRSATIAGAAVAGATATRVTSGAGTAPLELWVSEAALAAVHAKAVSDLSLWAVGIGLVALALFVLGSIGRVGAALDTLYQHRFAYGYLAPAMVGLAVLVFIPVVYGITLGFYERRYNLLEFAGMANYVAILSDFAFSNPANFYYKLGVTLLWTFTNVILHVSIGLFLALLLNDEMLKAKGIYRVLLVVPWAIPNYITALVWKGMFHKQFGAVNFFLEGMGMEPIAWFQSFWPAFFTNVATNTWLGFPFMMVVSLGALQSIPTDLYEAAFVDGASRWQRFRNITLPLLMPALVPAVIMGSVWTFNMFNIIFLVSGGAPDGATDILITDAYRWAFERDKYGYAAAYSTIIFVILLVFTSITNKVTGATKGAFE
jgi:arabinogalactan oligomer/maltooligosaccharide transport system permease protein